MMMVMISDDEILSKGSDNFSRQIHMKMELEQLIIRSYLTP